MVRLLKHKMQMMFAVLIIKFDCEIFSYLGIPNSADVAIVFNFIYFCTSLCSVILVSGLLGRKQKSTHSLCRLEIMISIRQHLWLYDWYEAILLTDASITS